MCGQEAGGGHTCHICKNIVHLIYGDPIGDPIGEEGYRQSVKCNNCHLNEMLIDYEYVNSNSDLLGFDSDTNVVNEDGKIERNDVIKDVTNERVEILERLWNLIPKSGLYLKNIIQFHGYAEVVCSD